MEAVILFGLAVCLAAYGIYKYNNAEVNAYNEVLQKMKGIDSRVSMLEEQSKIDQAKVNGMIEDICEAKKIAEQPKTLNLSMLQPLSVDIVQRPISKPPTKEMRKKLLKGTAKKLKELSQ